MGVDIQKRQRDRHIFERLTKENTSEVGEDHSHEDEEVLSSAPDRQPAEDQTSPTTREGKRKSGMCLGITIRPSIYLSIHLPSTSLSTYVYMRERVREHTYLYSWLCFPRGKWTLSSFLK